MKDLCEVIMQIRIFRIVLLYLIFGLGLPGCQSISLESNEIQNTPTSKYLENRGPLGLSTNTSTVEAPKGNITPGIQDGMPIASATPILLLTSVPLNTPCTSDILHIQSSINDITLGMPRAHLEALLGSPSSTMDESYDNISYIYRSDQDSYLVVKIRKDNDSVYEIMPVNITATTGDGFSTGMTPEDFGRIYADLPYTAKDAEHTDDISSRELIDDCGVWLRVPFGPSGIASRMTMADICYVKDQYRLMVPHDRVAC